jgi:uncharacterized protein (DUF1800 family)
LQPLSNAKGVCLGSTSQAVWSLIMPTISEFMRRTLFPFVLAIAALGALTNAAVAQTSRVYVINGTGSGTYATGGVVQLKAKTAPTGAVFSRWLVNGGIVVDSASTSTQLTLPINRPVVVAYALFNRAPLGESVRQPKAFPLNVVDGRGSGFYKAGATVSISPKLAPSGLVFKSWTAPAGLIADPTIANATFKMPASTTVVSATFVAVAAGQSVVTVTGGTPSGTYAVGSWVMVKADAPPAGQMFDKWTGDTAYLSSILAANTVVTVPAKAINIAANFKAAPVADIAVVVANGTGSGRYKAGTLVAITANAAAAGFKFKQWAGNASMVDDPTGSSAILTVGMPSVAGGSITVSATYEALTANGAVVLSSHVSGDGVSSMGETVFGAVTTVTTAATLDAVVSTSGRTVRLDLDKASGRFALRLFEGEANVGLPVNLTFTRTDLSGAKTVDMIALVGVEKSAALQQVAGRLSFGATPALLNEIKTVGYSAWVQRQLKPDSIPDTSLDQMNPDGLLRSTLEPWQLRDSIIAWRMAHAAYSQKQLREVIATFWNNHFWSTETDDNADMSDIDEMVGFRTNAFGKFRDLLAVSAHSPQMMYFLDNDRSRAGNINENYARELLELHTVGVNGGYGNDDVVAVARILTGWGAKQTSANLVRPIIHVFEFLPADHDQKDKIVPFLGLTFKAQAGAAGMVEGEQLLDVLAMHPKTQNFVCSKLVELLVSDTKPKAFVDLCVAAWASSGGHMGTVIGAILTSPSYLTTVDFQRSKVKTPYEAIVGYVRNFGVYPIAGKEVNFYDALRWGVQDSGMDMAYFSVPTGFHEDKGGWANTASFIQKFGNLTDQINWWMSPGNTTTRTGTVNYTQLLTAVDMKTPQAAAAYLLALGTSDRYRQDEYEMVVGALRDVNGFDITQSWAEERFRKTVGLIVTLPSYQLQ